MRADTVDKFQGGERPVVLVSMVTSPEIKGKGKKKLLRQRLQTILSMRKKSHLSGEVLMTAELILPAHHSFVLQSESSVAFSRAQNLLVILGNRFTLEQVNDVRIERDDGSIVEKSIFKNIHQRIGKRRDDRWSH